MDRAARAIDVVGDEPPQLAPMRGLIGRTMAAMRLTALLLLALIATASCGTQAPVPTREPSSVRVVVFMRDRSGSELWVHFVTAPDGRSGTTSGVTSGVSAACSDIPAAGTVAVVEVPSLAVRLPLYTAKVTDDERIFWVDAGPDGGLTHGEGRPDWASVTPRCPGTVQ